VVRAATCLITLGMGCRIDRNSDAAAAPGDGAPSRMGNTNTGGRSAAPSPGAQDGALILPANGHGDASSGIGQSPSNDGGGSPRSDAGTLDSPPPPTCNLADDLGPGEHTLDHDFGGVTRIVQLHVPPNYNPGRGMPLVFNLHPFVLGGPLLPIWVTESAMNAKSDEAGFLVVTPSGTGAPSAWNAGKECCGTPVTDNVDDVGFILHLIDYVSQRVCVDPRRVYSTGMSNGGYLSSRLGCEASKRIAAIAPVVGHLSAELDPCDLARPMPVLQISGASDSLEQRTHSYERWAEMDGCKDAEEETFNDGTGPGSARCVTHDDCNGGVEVTHCVVQAGHCWHSQVPVQATPGCVPTKSFHSPDQIWAFFSRFSLP